MRKLESIQERDMHKILWDFQKLMDPLIPTRNSHLVTKKVAWLLPFQHGYKVKRKWREKKKWTNSLPLPENGKTLLNMWVMAILIVVGFLAAVPKGLKRELEQLKIRSNPDYTIVEIGQNSQRGSKKSRRLAVTLAWREIIILINYWPKMNVKTHCNSLTFFIYRV